MNLPNKLTVLRLILTLFFVTIVSVNKSPCWTVGLLLFIFAAMTDYWDGAIARKHGLVTDFGKLMDPLADKVLMTGAFVMLVQVGLFPGWAAVAILAREFLVTGIRLVAAGAGKVVAADKWGKWKTVLQIVTVSLLIGVMAGREGIIAFLGLLTSENLLGNQILHTMLIWGTVALTLWSGWGYVSANRSLIEDA